jgi:5-deoxy-glucuronate isomerase
LQNLAYKSDSKPGTFQWIVSRGQSGLRYISFGRMVFGAAGKKMTQQTGSDEMVIDILGGKVTVSGKSPTGEFSFAKIGERENPFAGLPVMVYVPRNSTFEITAETENADIVIAAAPSKKDSKPKLIGTDEVAVKSVGADNWSRSVNTSIADNVDADMLLIGETLNPPGNWSSAPPHKHDVVKPPEAQMEEVYFFVFDPPQGFGMQRIYSGPDSPGQLDVGIPLENGTTVAIPFGYHPVVAGPGYKMLYVWVLAGDTREFGTWTDDPKHTWIKNTG